MKRNFQRGCQHKRLKKWYPYGKKSKPVIKCKDCNSLITLLQLRKLRKSKEERMRKNGRKRKI